MPSFIPGLQLSAAFYEEVVGPILARTWPGLRYAAGLLGPGSEVLGFDTQRSTDHNWGPRLLLFLTETDFPQIQAAISETLRQALPPAFRGYPTSFTPPNAEGTRLLAPTAGLVEHKVDITTVPRFVHDRLGIAHYPTVTLADWLTCTEQALLEVTAGAVFHDGLGDVAAMRATFRYYPHDLWLYLLAAQWARIGQLEPFVGRCGEVGDELGSALVAATLARDVMRLGFLLERAYAPYSKWFGTAFARLSCAAALRPPLQAALRATAWPEREQYLTQAYTHVATRHNQLGLTPPLDPALRPFHDRPFLVLDAGRFATALRAQITDPAVQQLPPAVGAVDQFVDSTDVLTNPALRARLRALYAGDAPT